MLELIKDLITERARAWEEAKGLAEEAQGRDFTAEEQEKWDRLNADLSAKRERIVELEELSDQGREIEEQRARLDHVVRPEDGGRQAEGDLGDRIRSFLRGGLPDAEGWSPRSVTFRITDADKAAAMEQRDLVKGTASAGGHTVPIGFVPRLYEHLVEESGVRRTGATIITTDSGEDLLVPKTATHPAAALVAEAAAIPESDPVFAQETLKAFKYGVLIQVAYELVQDTGVDLLGYLARQGGLALGRASGVHNVTGNGTGQPKGVADGAVVGKQGTTGQTTTVIADDLIDLFHSIVSGYRNRGVWLTLDASLAKIRKLKDADNQYIWQPGLQAGQPDLLLGKRVETDPNMPAMAANARSILFGDFSAYYTIRDVSSIRFERSDDFAFANDLISFRALMRTDGRQIDTGAVKAYQNSAT
jgi:HK97 family phage major capsid protein